MLGSFPDAPSAHAARIRQLCRLAVANHYLVINAGGESIGRILAMRPAKARTRPRTLIVDRGRGELEEIPLSLVAAVDTLDGVVVLTIGSEAAAAPAPPTPRLRLVVDNN